MPCRIYNGVSCIYGSRILAESRHSDPPRTTALVLSLDLITVVVKPELVLSELELQVQLFFSSRGSKVFLDSISSPYRI
jgi:hypothetical protein